MLCVTRLGSSQTCCSVRVVANIIMQCVWRLVPHPSSGQGGSAQIVKCARLAGKSGHKTRPFLFLCFITQCSRDVNNCLTSVSQISGLLFVF